MIYMLYAAEHRWKRLFTRLIIELKHMIIKYGQSLCCINLRFVFSWTSHSSYVIFWIGVTRYVGTGKVVTARVTFDPSWMVLHYGWNNKNKNKKYPRLIRQSQWMYGKITSRYQIALVLCVIIAGPNRFGVCCTIIVKNMCAYVSPTPRRRGMMSRSGVIYIYKRVYICCIIIRMSTRSEKSVRRRI